MAEFKLGRIRFIWKNNWATGVTYVKDDIVRNGGKTYVCVIGHTADTSFYTDLNHVPTRWNQVSDGSQWKGCCRSATGRKYLSNRVTQRLHGEILEREKKKGLQAISCNPLIFLLYSGADCRDRTGHLMITNQLLYQMS